MSRFDFRPFFAVQNYFLFFIQNNLDPPPRIDDTPCTPLMTAASDRPAGSKVLKARQISKGLRDEKRD